VLVLCAGLMIGDVVERGGGGGGVMSWWLVVGGWCYYDHEIVCSISTTVE
jgi:hypothetical protein